MRYQPELSSGGTQSDNLTVVADTKNWGSVAVLLRRRHRGGKWPFKTTDPVELLAKVSIRRKGTLESTGNQSGMEGKCTRSSRDRNSKKGVKEEEFELEVRDATW
jgi:hypothetical protein